jgi:hypothetical protein
MPKKQADDAYASVYESSASRYKIDRVLSGTEEPTRTGVWTISNGTFTPNPYGVLLVHSNSDDPVLAPGSGTFIFYEFHDTYDNKKYYRTNINGVLSAWKGAMEHTTSQLTGDLNALNSSRHIGVYSQDTSANASLALNYPLVEAGCLEVLPGPYGAQQRYTSFSSRWTYVRGQTGFGVWSSWVRAVLQAADNITCFGSGASYFLGNADGANNWYIGKGGSGNNILSWVSYPNSNRGVNLDNGVFYPNVNNVGSCGKSGNLWTAVYATNGTIQTSDARLKTPVAPLTPAELAAAQELAGMVGTWGWLTDVGSPDARLHIGVTVQQVIAVFESHELDAFKYSMVCYDEWEEEVDEHTGNVRPAGDLYSLRYEQFALFLSRGQQALIDAQEARIAALES